MIYKLNRKLLHRWTHKLPQPESSLSYLSCAVCVRANKPYATGLDSQLESLKSQQFQSKSVRN